jgi:hypothetical protein
MIKKLDKWEHIELESRIGKYWPLWKYVYDGIHLKYNTKINNILNKPIIFLDENEKEFLITQKIKTEDKGIIDIVILDNIAPHWYINSLLVNKEFLTKCNYKIIANSREDAILRLFNFTNFFEYKKKLRKGLKYLWNRCEKDLVFKQILKEEAIKYYLFFAHQKHLYWKEKLNLEVLPILDEYIITLSHFVSHAFLVLKEGEPIGFSWMFCEGKDEIEVEGYFYNLDFRRKYGIGNYIILKQIQLFFNDYKIYNFGANFFSYKKYWLTENREVKGIEKI